MGIAKYIDYREGFRREHKLNMEKGIEIHGPQRSCVSTTKSIRFDYQPDICKDYKETGYCGYGDACKFMHDRSDYKLGWQLENELKESQNRKTSTSSNWQSSDLQENVNHRDSKIPIACLICNEPWKNSSCPIKTICGHFFHEKCAIKSNNKSGRCFFCGESTKGIFNSTIELKSKNIK